MAATGVYTTAYREKLAQLSADELVEQVKSNMPVLWFAVGEGGYDLQPNGSKLPKAPSAAMTALEAPTNMAAQGGDNPLGGYFQKRLTPVQITRAGRDVTVRCILNANEPGLDNNSKLSGNVGGDPQMFEIGIYDGDITGPSTLMAYCTFDEVTKVPGVQITLNITIRY
jgi:hypothetical protein